MAGKISRDMADEVYRRAKAANRSFISELTGSGVVSAFDVAHVMSQTFSAPLLDVDALDLHRLPTDLLNRKRSFNRALVLAWPLMHR